MALTQPQPPAASIDAVAAYWNARPCNLRHSKATVGSRQYFDEVEARKYFVEPHIPGFAQFADWKGKRVLEIGCGIGTDAVNFARAGATYTGLELSSESLALAKTRFEVFGLSGEFVQGDAEGAEALLAGREFDLIYSFGVIHHTPNPHRVLAAARRLIAPEGQLKIMVYAKGSWKDIMIGAGLDQPEAQSGCPIAYRYTREEGRERLARAAFEPTANEQNNIYPYVIEHYVNYEYVIQPWFAAMPSHMFEALERELGWHLLLTGRPSAGSAP